MLKVVFIGVALLLLSLGAAWAVDEAQVTPFDWPEETTFEFAIYSRSSGERMATAYYRVLKEESEGRAVYHFKYHARNDALSEAAECFIYPDTMLPLRSTRKTTDNVNTYYQDVAYGDGTIIVRRRTNDNPVVESKLPAAGKFYDYESLIWLVPQIEFGGADQVYLNLFVTLNETKSTVLVSNLGPQQVTILGNTYVTQGYAFNVNSGHYQLFTVVQDGHPVPARIDMGDFSFLNAKISPKNVDSPVSASPPAQPVSPAPALPKPAPPKPAEPPKEDQPADPGDNPLGPPPPGGRF